MSEPSSTLPTDESGQPPVAPLADPAAGGGGVAITIVVAVALVVALVLGLFLRARAGTNHESLSQRARPVSTARAHGTTYRSSRTYVGTIQPWNAARVGPQFVSAYVGAVLVRPGALVRRGDVLATLDCRGSSAQSRAIAAKARAASERQTAAEHESVRLKSLESGGFASANESEQLQAKSKSELAELESVRASLQNRALEVDDCILRAPFTGEVSERYVDPGAYVRPGNPVVTVIDRGTVRIVADAPESDFAVVAPGTPVSIVGLSTAAKLSGPVSRRAPAADEQARTVHFEIDLPNRDRRLPVGTTARLTIDVGAPLPATSIPLRAATIRGDKATVFIVEKDAGNAVDNQVDKPADHDGHAGRAGLIDNQLVKFVARRRVYPVLGEIGGVLYLDPRLASEAAVVVEGRALLDDGDRVLAKEIQP